ncbi:MAG: hypothetical protein IJC08_00810, partial [Bacteroidaceae bacterium]|nr:hypothetical protein [Bacteroidaceae bacterium]
ERIFIGIDGKPCLHKDGYAKFTYKYDDRGNITETACYDQNNNLCITNYGYAVAIKIYNKKDGTRESIEYLDTERKLIAKLYPIAYIAEVSGWAQQNRIEPGSILLEWNEWKFEDGINDFSLLLDKNRYSKKEILLITPNGTIKKYITDEVVLGVGIVDNWLEESKIDAIKVEYEKWKAKNK